MVMPERKNPNQIAEIIAVVIEGEKSFIPATR
jgi:hypothetical protein